MLNKNLRLRFVVYFVTTMFISTLIASGAIFFFIQMQLDRQLVKSQDEIAEVLTQMVDSGESSILETFNISSYEVYGVHRIEESDPRIERHLEALAAGEMVTEEHWLLPSVNTYFAREGQYYQVSLFPTTGILMMTAVSLLSAVAAALLLGTIISSFTGKRFLRPIRELCSATEEVAKGNFAVRVEVPRNIEMGRLCSNFNQMTHDLSRIETLRSEFTSNVSHEFKTPLASIKGFASLLQQGGLSDEERCEYAGIIVEESERLSRLSSSILRLTKLENTDRISDCSEIELDEQIRRCILLFDHQWSGKNIDINIELEPVTVYSSAELLQEVWTNLLSNAIKFTPEGGQIDVRLTPLLDTVQVEIEDSGCGMDKETAERIFEKFYQGDRSHSSEGNGLGLPLVKRILQLCRGSIAVSSIPGEGTCFTVTLPRE